MLHDQRTTLQALHDIRQRLEAAENSGDSVYIGSMMADDAVIMVPDFPVQEGRDACAAFVHEVLSGLLDHFHRSITYVSTEVRVIGDYAFDRGSFSFTVVPKTGGEMSEARGKYLWLYSGSADGSWKLARLIVSLDEDEDREREKKSRPKTAFGAIGRWLMPRWRGHRWVKRREARPLVAMALGLTVVSIIVAALGFGTATPTGMEQATERPRTERPRPPKQPETRRGSAAARPTAVGVASFIAASLEGRKTASGERYDGSAMVAAHRTYPLGTRLRVTNLANGRAVIVRVIDRMGPRRGRRSPVIDLSRAAAERLGFVREGTTSVKMEVIGKR